MITISLSYYYLDLSFYLYYSSLIPAPTSLCGAGSVIVDVLSGCGLQSFEAHSLMYYDKSSNYSEQPPQNYSVSVKEVMNCKDPSLKNEVNNPSLYNLLPIIFSVILHFTIIILNIFFLLFLVILITCFNIIFIQESKDD